MMRAPLQNRSSVLPADRLPRRILMTADTVGGVWTYALELARALARHDVSVTLATMGPLPSARQSREAAELPNLELVSTNWKLEWMDDPWRDVDAAGGWLLELEQRVRPDLIHLNGYTHGQLPWSAPTVVVAHSCVLSWWNAVKNKPAPAVWSEYQQRVRAGLQATSLVIAPSQWMLSELREYYGALPAAAVIYNGREIEPRLPEKEPLIFAAGRIWDEAKNIRLLSAVAPELSWKVAVAGDSGTAEWPGVQLLGRLERDEMTRWLWRSSIYAFAAKYEPFGLSVLEAALARCALVLGDIPSLREIWGDSALYVDTQSPGPLRRMLEDLIAAPDALEELADRAYARALEFTPDRMVAQYLSAYAALLAPEKPMAEVPEALVCES